MKNRNKRKKEDQMESERKIGEVRSGVRQDRLLIGSARIHGSCNHVSSWKSDKDKRSREETGENREREEPETGSSARLT
jgi:hypothetical protein